MAICPRVAKFVRRHTLRLTAWVREVYVRFFWQDRARAHNRGQFFDVVAAGLLRRLLVDDARGQQSKKRQIALDEALQRLSEMDPRKGRVIELRIFRGLTIEKTAELLGVSIGTVINDYRAAKAWLRRELER